mmetsp:Transcript_60442/g.179046  ORF Transcript_60442/g.179046 Transcript_60442/m.179046 type:complete len:330 (-) Transcript_60442:493-1482(-)|eukprot:CAMPEP_0113568228 /NCGR_PEP_ID=MMETSP0015_2-20120614/23732_1 /TAXON_ID=2838 /ORGANISM="Odontella" /LENGTH=329 /DNA_ID=CAMNT_0000470745 /DNA_START=235 /DNA_END=1224 /DNA_ORIENTATION=- /assembly_acc=CAM_ASM_000160
MSADDFLQTVNIGEEALGGLAAGIVGTVLGFPLDLIKTRMQTGVAASAGAGAGGGVRPPGMFGVASQIVRSEGALALYKGIGPPLVSLSIINTLSFTSYSYFRGIYRGSNGWDVRNSYAGMTGAPVFGLITTPENFLKTQMQMDNVRSRRFRGSLHCASVLVREHGFRVLYTGHAVNMTREAAFVGCYFYCYEGFRETFLRGLTGRGGGEGGVRGDEAAPSLPPTAMAAVVPLAGGMAGACSWLFSFPLDCVRAGVQGRDLGDPIRRGAVRVFADLLATKGVGGLYAGVGPSIARAFLVSGSRFSAYEGALWLFRGGRDRGGVQHIDLK